MLSRHTCRPEQPLQSIKGHAIAHMPPKRSLKLNLFQLNKGEEMDRTKPALDQVMFRKLVTVVTESINYLDF